MVFQLHYKQVRPSDMFSMVWYIEDMIWYVEDMFSMVWYVEVVIN